MKNLIFILLLISFNAIAQGPPTGTYSPINGGFNYQRVYLRALNIPAGTSPALSASQWPGSGALYYDSTGTDTGLYVFHNPYWVKVGVPTSLTTIGSTPNANGATISGSVLNLQPASGSFGGVVTTTTQTLGAGVKTFSSDAVINGRTIGRGTGNQTTNVAYGNAAVFANTSGTVNIGIGNGALRNNTTGGNNSAFGNGALTGAPGAATPADNTATGFGALTSVTTAARNNAHGMSSLTLCTSCSDNVGMGNNSLLNLISGIKNNATGNGAMENATTASYNDAHGMDALLQLLTGIENTGFGYLANAQNRTGNYNNGFGAHTLRSMTNANYVTAIGRGAGYLGWDGINHMKDSLRHVFLIGNNTWANRSNIMVFGDDSIFALKFYGVPITTVKANKYVTLFNPTDSTLERVHIDSIGTGGGGSGTVTSFTAPDGNGFDFTVTDPTTTPTLTATTTVANTRIFYSNSGAMTGDANFTWIAGQGIVASGSSSGATTPPLVITNTNSNDATGLTSIMSPNLGTNNTVYSFYGKATGSRNAIYNYFRNAGSNNDATRLGWGWSGGSGATQTDQLVLQANGNIGMGVAAPTHGLTLNGQIKVFAPQAGDVDSIATWKDGVISATLASALTGVTPTLSSLTAATGTNSINNAANRQSWSWDAIAAGYGMSILASATTSQTGSVLFQAERSGVTATSSVTSYAARLFNQHSGTGSVNVGAIIGSTNGATNYALVVPANSGSVGIGNSAPNSLVHISGSFATGYRALTALRTLDETDHTIEVTANTFTVTLPTAVGITGRQYVVTNSGSGTVTVGTTSSETFVNVLTTPTTLTLAQFATVIVVSNGANWLRITSL